MLGDEHRMAAHRCLLAVIEGQGGGKPLRNKITCMSQDRIETPLGEISLFPRIQAETGPERGTCESSKQGIEVVHAGGI